MYKAANYTEFLERYYMELISSLFRDYPEQKTLTIDFKDFEIFDFDAANWFLDHPETEMKKMREKLQEIGTDYEDDISFTDLKISIKNLTTACVPISRIGSAHLGKFISVEGRINKIGKRQPKLIFGAFVCQRCDHTTIIKQPSEDKIVEPYECENDICNRKGPFKLNILESVWIDEQKLELQDLYEDNDVGKPLRNVRVIVQGEELIENVPAIGAEVIITGIIKQVRKDQTFDIILKSNNIKPTDPDTNLELSASDTKELMALAANEDILDKLIQSTSSAVLGYPEIKLSLLLSAVSGPNHKLPEGGTLRGYVHVAIVGDPGTAKTVMTEGIRALVPRAQYAAGRGASGVGLTVAAVKDDLGGGGYVAQAGALVLADKGLLVIDEFEKLEPEDIQSLNTALESGCFPINKGGLNQTFSSSEPVIVVLNPKHIRFDDDEPLTQQISIPADVLSRFDLIFKIKDTPEPERDRKIAEHLGKLWQQAGKPDNKGAVIPLDQMRKYLALAKTMEPVITEDISKAITEYYVKDLRKYEGGVIKAGPRDLNALFRLTKSIAKLRLSETCSIDDVNRAISLHQASQEAIRDPTTGMVDSDIIYGMGKSQRDRLKTLRGIIRELQGDNGAFYNDIVSIAKTKNITLEQLESDIKHSKQRGDIIEIKDGVYRLV